MRAFLIGSLIVLLSSVTLSAQQRVVKFGYPGAYVTQPCQLLGLVDQCAVEVYTATETRDKIAAANVAANVVVLDQCQKKVDDSKSQILEAINKLSPDVVAAIKAQVKEEIKAEVLNELIEQIKTGKLKIPVQAAPRGGS